MKPVFHKKQFTISTQQPKQNEKKQNDSEPKKQPKQTQMNEQFYQPQQFNHYQYQQQFQHHQIVQVTQPLQNNQYNQQKQFQQVQNTQKDSQKEIKQQTQIYNQNNQIETKDYQQSIELKPMKDKEQQEQKQIKPKDYVTAKQPKSKPTYHGFSAFVDNEFPADERSIGKIPNRSLIKQIQWLRPEQFMEKVKLFDDGISPNDIEQGRLGDCFFLASLSALAENPQRIKKMITKLGNGKYEVITYYQGNHTNLVVDDLIPCVNGKPVFSRNKGNELWVLLLEKAYAKISGSYAGLEGGVPYRSMNDLTGMPSTIIKRSDYKKKTLCKKLLSYKKKDYCIIASIDEYSDEIKLKQKYGLIPFHAYTILDVIPYKENHFVKIRNPWAETEWKGHWNDHDPQWTSKMKKALNFDKVADDGVFFMEYNEFIHFFSTFNVCYYKDTWKHYVGFQMNFQQKQVALPFECDGECIISIVQPDDENRVGISFWCVDQNDIPIGGESPKAFSSKYLLKGRKANFKGIKYCRLIVEICQDDLDKLPMTLNFEIRSNSIVRLGKANYIKPKNFLGYGTKEAAATAQKCVACGFPLTIGRITVTEQLGGFHDKCFKCAKCKKHISGMYYRKDGKPYCELCGK